MLLAASFETTPRREEAAVVVGQAFLLLLTATASTKILSLRLQLSYYCGRFDCPLILATFQQGVI